MLYVKILLIYLSSQKRRWGCLDSCYLTICHNLNLICHCFQKKFWFAILLIKKLRFNSKKVHPLHQSYVLSHSPFLWLLLVMNISLFKLKYIKNKINHNWNVHSHLSLNMPNAIFLWYVSLLLVAVGSLGALSTNYSINFLLKNYKKLEKVLTTKTLKHYTQCTT